MTVNELLELLEEASNNGHGDIQVRIAYQPNYPLAASVSSVTTPDDIDDDEDEDDDIDDLNDRDRQVLWIAAGDLPSTENPYAPRSAWQ